MGYGVSWRVGGGAARQAEGLGGKGTMTQLLPAPRTSPTGAGGRGGGEELLAGAFGKEGP